MLLYDCKACFTIIEGGELFEKQIRGTSEDPRD